MLPAARPGIGGRFGMKAGSPNSDSGQLRRSCSLGFSWNHSTEAYSCWLLPWQSVSVLAAVFETVPKYWKSLLTLTMVPEAA